MPLHIKLKPNERMIINGASICNGDRGTSFMIESQCKFLRETEIVRESEVDTLCKKLALIVQVIHLSENSDETNNMFNVHALEIVRIMPALASKILEIQGYIMSGETYQAVKAGRQLIQLERDLLKQAENERGVA
ncbi:flagellar biosynthesis repressor FlbT [Methylorubrum sp. POS3]|uniref:flagellar biosynthesis repressor FlbT n=1 Tax=Methylorubrum sp. POS3 TaxID=2998492 RepID=UPI00372C6ED0